MRRPLPKFWVLVYYDADVDQETIRGDWPTAHEAYGYNARLVAESEAEDVIDNDEEAVVIVASTQDGSDAQRFTVSRETVYHVSGGEKIDVKPLPLDNDGEVIKGTQDNQTLNLFAST